MSPFVAWLLGLFGSVGGLIFLVVMTLAVTIPFLYIIVHLFCQKEHLDIKSVYKAR